VSRVFFRHIEVVGRENIPATGAVLFVGNHPNSLIDPVLIITTCGRKVHFAAKDTLFKSRILRQVLRGLGAVPIARRADHAGGKLDNEAAFAAMYDVLGGGGVIGIFPEGISHDESQLATLKTGAARLALGAAARHPSTPVYVVPCGLTFIHPKRFRSRVLVQYGEPIRIDDAWRERHAADGQAAARALTGEIERDLRGLTINAPDWATVRSLDAVRRLYQPLEISLEERIELSRRFNAYYAAVARDPRVVAAMADVAAYQQKLDELGVTDRELARDLSKLEVAGRVMHHLGLVLFWLPMALPGAPLHVPTVVFARIAGKRLTPRKDVIATTKMLIGIGLVLLSYAIVIAYLAWQVDWIWAGVAAIVLPLSGLATLRVLDRLRLVRRGVGTLARRLRFRSEVAALRIERAALVKRVVALVDSVRPASVTPLFPPDHPARRRGLDEDIDARENADLDSELDKDAVEEPS
jgi:1-acyl-sn-glycerol-3-phosphate acyltransferase